MSRRRLAACLLDQVAQIKGLKGEKELKLYCRTVGPILDCESPIFLTSPIERAQNTCRLPAPIGK